MQIPRFAVVSHILPPSGSGQAVMLYRVLSAVPDDRFCLISIKDYSTDEMETRATERFSVPYYRLRFCRQLPMFKSFGFAKVTATINVLLTIVHRAVQIAAIAKKERCEMLMACTGDLYDLPAAYLASRWCGVPFVPYIFDDYAYQWVGFNRELAKRFERVIMRGAHEVIVPNEFMRQEYVERHNVSSVIVRNPCHLSHPLSEKKPACRKTGSGFSVVYTGAIYHAHYDAFRNMVAALVRLGRPDVKLHLYTAQTEDELKAQGVGGEMVKFHPHVPQESVPEILYNADVLFLPLAFETTIPEVIKTSAPGKLGEYLSTGRPLLVHAPHDSFVSWYVRANKCGMVVDRNSSQALSEALLMMIEDPLLAEEMGTRAREQAEKDFSLNVVQEKFQSVLQGGRGTSSG